MSTNTGVLMTDTEIQSAIHLAQGVIHRLNKQDIPLSQAETLMLAKAVMMLAFQRRRLGNDDPHDMPSEFITPNTERSTYPSIMHENLNYDMCVLCSGPILAHQHRRRDARGWQHSNTCPTPLAASGVNSRQVGGSHYGLKALQHWDIVAMFKLDYFQGQITKYIMRWRDKNGVEDLEKAVHYLEKYITVNKKAIVDDAQLSLEDVK